MKDIKQELEKLINKKTDLMEFGIECYQLGAQSKQELIDCQQALEKTVGILFNIRHETDYMPDSYYEWIDKVINEVDEHLPVYDDELNPLPQPPIV